MYKIVDYDAFWSYPKAFNTFSAAFSVYNTISDRPGTIIEHYDIKNQKKEVVWDPSWSNIELNIIPN